MGQRLRDIACYMILTGSAALNFVRMSDTIMWNCTKFLQLNESANAPSPLRLHLLCARR